MHIALIGGTEEERIQLNELLALEDPVCKVSFFSSAHMAENLLDPATVSIVLLDGDSEPVNWVEEYRILRQLAPAAHVVLVSNRKNAALKAYEVGVWDYILKPAKTKQLRRILDKAAVQNVRSPR